MKNKVTGLGRNQTQLKKELTQKIIIFLKNYSEYTKKQFFKNVKK